MLFNDGREAATIPMLFIYLLLKCFLLLSDVTTPSFYLFISFLFFFMLFNGCHVIAAFPILFILSIYFPFFLLVAVS